MMENTSDLKKADVFSTLINSKDGKEKVQEVRAVMKAAYPR